MKVLKTTDRLKVTIDTLTFFLSPLSYNQKEMINLELIKGTIESTTQAAKLSLKYSIKDILGLENMDGSNYEIVKDDDGLVSDECLDDLFNLELNQKITTVCAQLINNVPADFIDPETGDKLKGVRIIKEATSRKK